MNEMTVIGLDFAKIPDQRSRLGQEAQSEESGPPMFLQYFLQYPLQGMIGEQATIADVAIEHDVGLVPGLLANLPVGFAGYYQLIERRSFFPAM
jgi:hypothetical protein